MRMICSAEGLVRFLAESPPKSGRMQTLTHHGPVFGSTGVEPGLSLVTAELKRHQQCHPRTVLTGEREVPQVLM